jgi:hypothetical protein
MIRLLCVDRVGSTYISADHVCHVSFELPTDEGESCMVATVDGEFFHVLGGVQYIAELINEARTKGVDAP